MSSYASPIVNNKPPEVVDPGFYCDIRYDPTDASPTYVGLNVTNMAPTSNKDWKIYKYTYSGSSRTRVQSQTGVWDNRASLNW